MRALIARLPLLLLALGLWLPAATQAARILGIFPTPSISHQLPYQAVMKALAARGHQITVISPDPLKEPVANYTDIDLSFSYKLFREMITFADMSEVDPVTVVKLLTPGYFQLVDEQLGSKQIQDFLKYNASQGFDLVFYEWWGYEALFGLIHAVGSPPQVGILSFGGTVVQWRSIGNPHNPAINPDALTGFTDQMTFWERVQNLMSNIRLTWHWEGVMFTEHVWIDGAEHGVIYFSLGTNILCKDLPPEKLQAILRALARLPQRVLWKFENDTLPGQPPNVRISKWLPQQDILESASRHASSDRAPALAAARPGLWLPAATQAARILGIFPTPSISHQLPYQAVMKELALRGHQITVISPDPLKEPVANYTDVDISFSYEYFRLVITFADMSEVDPVTMLEMMTPGFIKLVDKQLSSEQIKDFLRYNATQGFDLVFFEWWGYEAFFGLIHAVGSPPVIGILSFGGSIVQFRSIGNPHNPAVNPDVFTGFSEKMTFWERVQNLIAMVRVTRQWEGVMFHEHEKLMRKHFGSAPPSVYDTSRNLSLLILCNHWTLEYPRALLPNVLQLTGLHVREETRPLPADLQAWLDGAEQGVVYFSLRLQ
ncbi:UDP-glucuronosyltransferase 2B15, partial [Gryllus bimaculatus]